VTEGLADTSVFIAAEDGRSIRLVDLPDRLAVSVITVGELRAGVLAARDLATRNRRLATLTAVLAMEPVPVDEDVAAAWAQLRVALRDAGREMGVNDSWIAATALALDVPLVTQDQGIRGLPGVDVILV
jgi:predicted nucleic acid-binding protein